MTMTHKIDVNAALSVIRTIYRNANEIMIVQTFTPLTGWQDIAPLPFASINELDENVSAVQLRLKKPGETYKFPDFQMYEFRDAEMQMKRPKLNKGDAVIYDRRPVGEKSIEGTVHEVRLSKMAPDRCWVVDVKLESGAIEAFPAERVYALHPWRMNAGLTLDVNQGSRDASVMARDGMEVLVEYEMPAGSTTLVIMDIAVGNIGYKTMSYGTLTRKWIAALQSDNGAGLDSLSWNPQGGGLGNGHKAYARAMEIAAKLGKLEWK